MSKMTSEFTFHYGGTKHQTEGGGYEDVATLRKYNGTSSNVVIPSRSGSMRVGQIGPSAFQNCSSLVNITIPKGTKYIGHLAFAGCNNLVNADLPDGLMQLGHGVFERCPKLVNLNIPASVRDIGHNIVDGNATTIFVERGSYAEQYARRERLKIGGKKQGCFIATACYGDARCIEVLTLQAFRDNALMKYLVGRWCIYSYYAISPTIAAYLSQHSMLAKLVKVLALAPLTALIRRLPYRNGIEEIEARQQTHSMR